VNASAYVGFVGQGFPVVIAQLIGPAVVVAWSPVRVLPALAVVVQTRRPKAAALAFLAGSLAGITVVTAVIMSVPAAAERFPRPSTAVTTWAALVVGLALLIVAAYSWRHRHDARRSKSWASRAPMITPTAAATLGVALSITNIKVLAANAAAALIIGSAALHTAGVVAALAAYIAVSGSTIIVPVIAYLWAEDRVEGMLGSVRQWIERHQSRIVLIGSAVLGAALVAGGLGALLGR
jgi:hypothetical protein